MSDWGTGASSSKHSKSVAQEPVRLYGPYNCIRCGMSYMPRRVYYGNYICPKCEKAERKRQPSPPSPEQSAAVQMTLDDIINAKK